MTDLPAESAPAAAPPADPHLGLALGKYLLVERLGKGGMGVVYIAEDTFLQRRVAVKLLPESVTGAPEVLARFQIEARAAARLNHPNVVAIYDVGIQDGIAFLVMELVRGVSAQDLLQSRGALPWEEATSLVADVCRGLAAAHAAGLVHRDIKPANIMLPEQGGAKLADFGLAKSIVQSAASITGGAILGTPHYMCPEQCRAERVDERGDLYSLGATYFALLTGKPPYAGEAALQLMFAHCSNPVPDPRDVRPDVPERCAAIVLRAMAKEPPDRFASAEDMLAELDAARGARREIPADEGRPATSQVFDSTRSVPGMSRSQDPQPLTKEDLFGEAAVRNNFVTREQLDECLAARRETGTSADLATILHAKGFVTEGQVEKLRRAVEVAWRRLHPEEPILGELPSEESVDPLVGKVLAGEFRIERLIGRGGMGSVYLADQLSLARRVAVKVLPHGPHAPTEAIERFRREAKSVARLQHPNIVQVFFSGEEAGQHFIVMEYVEGIAVGERLGRGRNIPSDEAVGIAAGVARGLAAAHQQGIVHRDLKPDNIFLALDGAVKLGDFGLARDLSGNRDVSISGTVLGTPLYMAPEQCQGKKVDGRADLYSLGATLYHLVTGRPPYLGNSLLEIMNRHVSAPVPSARAIAPEVPAGLDILIRRLMQKDPAQRPQTAGEVASLLDTVLTDPVLDLAPEAARATPAFEMPTRTSLAPSADLAPQPTAFLRAAGMAAGILISLGVGYAAFSFGSAKNPVKTADPVLTKTSDPVPAKSTVVAERPAGTPELAAARKALAADDLAAAFAILNALSPAIRYGPLTDTCKQVRQEAVQAAEAHAQKAEANLAALVEAMKFEEADAVIEELSTIGAQELNDRIAQGHTRVKDARSAAEAAHEAEVTRVAAEAQAQEQAARLAGEQAEAAWVKLAPQVWAAAGKGNWGAALKSCAMDIAGREDRVAALRRILDLGLKADEAIAVAFQRVVEVHVSLERAKGVPADGILESVVSGLLNLKTEDNKGHFGVEIADLSGRELLTWACRGLGEDPSHPRTASAPIYVLASGDPGAADAYLIKSREEKGALQDDLAAAGTGWDAPWSAEAIALREKKVEPKENPPANKPPQGKTPAVVADDLTKLNDDFKDAGTLKRSWRRLKDDIKGMPDYWPTFEIDKKTNDRLTIVPNACCWYNDFRGDLLYKKVEGDFVVTTSVRVQSKSGEGTPNAAYSVAGLVARAPREMEAVRARGGENCLFALLGVAEPRSDWSFEFKITTNGKSQKPEVTPLGKPEAQLRIFRMGVHFFFLSRLQGKGWTMQRHAVNKEVPQSLEVGLTAYSDWVSCGVAGLEEHNAHGVPNGKPDLRADFDYVHFHRPRMSDAARKSFDRLDADAVIKILGDDQDN